MLTPERFAETSVYDLLVAAGQGKVGMDHRWLHAIVDRGEAAVPDLVRFGTEDRSEDPVVLDEELLALFRHLRSPQSIPFFVEFLRSHPEELPDSFSDSLAPVRQAAIEPLLKLYDEMEEDQSGEVAFTLAGFRIHDDRILQILTDRLEYDITDGAICLSLYGDPAARPVLEKTLASIDDAHLQKQLRDAIEDIQRAVEEESEPEFDIFAEFPEKSGPESSVLETADLLVMLESQDPDYRFAAAAGFINREVEAEHIEKLLEHARTDAQPAVRAKSWEALGSEVAENDKVFEAMLSRLQDETAPLVERAGALVGLGQRADEDSIRPFAEKFYENPDTRAAALSAMWNSLDRNYSKYFPAHLEDEDPVVRKQAIAGVGYLGIQDSAEKLRQYFEDDEFRSNALFAYALSARSEISPARIRTLYRRIEQFAGGLTEEEEELVQIALDERLMLHGHKPVFHADEHRHHDEHVHGPDCKHEHEPAPAAPAKPAQPKVGRNDPCPCGSGKKYKKCCGA